MQASQRDAFDASLYARQDDQRNHAVFNQAGVDFLLQSRQTGNGNRSQCCG